MKQLWLFPALAQAAGVQAQEKSLLFLLTGNPGNKAAGITSEISTVLHFAASQHFWLLQPQSFLSQYQHHVKF